MSLSGAIGPLPVPAWAAVAWALSPPHGEYPRTEDRAALLVLRSVSRRLCAVVAAASRGGAGTCGADDVDEAPRSLGRALICCACDEDGLAAALDGGHMVEYAGDLTPGAAALLRSAHQGGQLYEADLGRTDAEVLALAPELGAVALLDAEDEILREIGRRGVVSALSLCLCTYVTAWTALRGLRWVSIEVADLDDLAPLADVEYLEVARVPITSIPAMRNVVLRVEECDELDDITALGLGCVRFLTLRGLRRLADVDAIGLMDPPPRFVKLSRLPQLRSVAALTGVGQLCINSCKHVR